MLCALEELTFIAKHNLSMSTHFISGLRERELAEIT